MNQPSNMRQGIVSSSQNFHAFITHAAQRGVLIVQPRMGFSDGAKMRSGLSAVKSSVCNTLGTVTLDSFTRLGLQECATEAIRLGQPLNGYPILSYSADQNRRLIQGIASHDFPIQVRHGSPKALDIFKALLEAGIDATEGGPISYCLPYGRVPLTESIKSWVACCQLFAEYSSYSHPLHIESFGGCLMGQLCPPSLLVAISVLECLFMQQVGVQSVSLSYAQGSSTDQDRGALAALRMLAEELLSQGSWHIVVYCFMGKFPETRSGAKQIIQDSARLAKLAGATRLIVKTAVEAHQIPSINDNIEALQWAATAAVRDNNYERGAAGNITNIRWHTEVVYQQARAIIESVLNLSPDLAKALAIAFTKGYLDIPYCLHQDNKRDASAWVDHLGNIQWAETGSIPFPSYLKHTIYKNKQPLTSSDLLTMLSYNQIKYDIAWRNADRGKNKHMEGL